MDGVVADWQAGAARIVGYELAGPTDRYPDSDWQLIRSNQRIFRDLPLMQGAAQLANTARQFRDQLGYQLLFLTAIPHYNDVHWAFWDKVCWAQDYFPDIPVHFGPYSEDKHRHCVPGDILVDDRPDNCDQWQAAGGTAILVMPNRVIAAAEQLSQLLASDQIKR